MWQKIVLAKPIFLRIFFVKFFIQRNVEVEQKFWKFHYLKSYVVTSQKVRVHHVIPAKTGIQ